MRHAAIWRLSALRQHQAQRAWASGTRALYLQKLSIRLRRRDDVSRRAGGQRGFASNARVQVTALPSPQIDEARAEIRSALPREQYTELRDAVINFVRGEGDHAVLHSLAEKHGYSSEEVSAWLALLQSRPPKSLLQQAIGSVECGERGIPLFVLEEVLERRLPTQVIQTILNYIHTVTTHWHALDSEPCDVAEKSLAVSSIFAKLIEHGRSWPQALPTIANLAATWTLHTTPQATSSMNALLTTLARPSHSEPFKNASLQSRAQAVVVRYMVQAEFPLELGGDGFRAIASVQLMLRKNPAERRWAELKALTWPPWKEDKTRLDTLLGPEHGISDALNTLDQAQAAGHAANAWARVARLYAGWDTDDSPTIQTRQYLGPIKEWQESVMLWTARVRVTRTMDEAWAAFLSYTESNAKWQAQVCQAYLEKLIFASKRDFEHRRYYIYKQLDVVADALPGDGPEVQDPPPSAHQQTYTPTPPPGIEAFVDSMLKHGVFLDDEAVAYLLSEMYREDIGVVVLRTARSLSARTTLERAVAQAVDGELSDKMSRAIFKFARQFPRHPAMDRLSPRTQPSVQGWLLRPSPMTLQVEAMRSGQTWTYADAYDLLRSLADQRHLTPVDFAGRRRAISGALDIGLVDVSEMMSIHPSLFAFKSRLDRVIALDIALEVVRTCGRKDILLNNEALIQLLKVGRTAVEMAHEMLAGAGAKIANGRMSRSAVQALEELVDDAHRSLTIIKHELRPTLFALLLADDVVTSTYPAQSLSLGTASTTAALSPAPTIKTGLSLPRLAITPSPAMLHLAVRSFGSADDFEGLLQLTRFMRDFWPELERRMEEDRQGRGMFRKTIVALRLYLAVGREASRRDGDVEDVLGRVLASSLKAPSVEEKALLAGRPDPQDAIDACDALTGAEDFAEHESLDVQHDPGMAAPSAVVDDIRSIVESMGEAWGGWSDDDEVVAYVSKGRGQRR